MFESIAIIDNRNGNAENTNGGAYIWRAQFSTPIPGVYYYREIASFHGDLQPFPVWESVTLPQFISLYKQAVKMNHELPEDLRI